MTVTIELSVEDKRAISPDVRSPSDARASILGLRRPEQTVDLFMQRVRIGYRNIARVIPAQVRRRLAGNRLAAIEQREACSLWRSAGEDERRHVALGGRVLECPKAGTRGIPGDRELDGAMQDH